MPVYPQFRHEQFDFVCQVRRETCVLRLREAVGAERSWVWSMMGDEDRRGGLALTSTGRHHASLGHGTTWNVPGMSRGVQRLAGSRRSDGEAFICPPTYRVINRLGRKSSSNIISGCGSRGAPQSRGGQRLSLSPKSLVWSKLNRRAGNISKIRKNEQHLGRRIPFWSKPIPIQQQALAIPGGLEPPTNSLEGCCSIQLSYGTRAG